MATVYGLESSIHSIKMTGETHDREVNELNSRVNETRYRKTILSVFTNLIVKIGIFISDVIEQISISGGINVQKEGKPRG